MDIETNLVTLNYISGLKEIVLAELAKNPSLHVLESSQEELVLECEDSELEHILKLKSVLNGYLMARDAKYNPTYLSKHKSLLGNLIEKVLKVNGKNAKNFKTYKVSCAGSDSPEVRDIEKYINETFKIGFSEHEADLKISIGKTKEMWEISVAMTPRPLSLRSYKVENLKGAINPCVAYAMNSFCYLETISSYLNICSGSATFLIEAGLVNPKLKLQGFDIDGKTNALAIANIRKAGLIKKIKIEKADLLEKPELGTFDAIVSDLPFGMLVSKGKNIPELYKAFVEYCEHALNPGGILVAYTTEHEILEPIIGQSKFKIVKILSLKFLTNVDSYLQPKIFVCRFK